MIAVEADTADVDIPLCHRQIGSHIAVGQGQLAETLRTADVAAAVRIHHTADIEEHRIHLAVAAELDQTV